MTAPLISATGLSALPPDSPEAGALLAEQGLSQADLDRALAHLERTEGIRVRTIVGINEDGVFGSTREGWHPDLPDACKEPFVPLLWLKVHELLGRVPEGQHRPVPQGRHPARLIGPTLPYAAAASCPTTIALRWRGSSTGTKFHIVLLALTQRIEEA